MNKIAVVGDAIIDEYYYVNAEKVSPEFPIPILQSDLFFPQRKMPGGAANVCYQFCNFDKHISYFGLVDKDALFTLEDFIETDCCMLMRGSNPRKKRFYQNNFPLCRIDFENKNYGLSNCLLNELQDKICKNLSNSKFDIVIFSDYDKGVFNDFDTQIYLRSAGSALKIVDPKNGPASKWFGCDIIKPNYKEAKSISGLNNWKDQANFFRDQTKAKAIIITHGGDGIFGLIENDYFEFIPDKKTIPVSVIGAGDCFVSLLSIFISDGLGIFESIKNAFYGASLYVENKYNKPIHPADLSKNKIVKPEVLSKRDFTLAFTNGCFDFGLTSAHVDLVEYAKQKKDKLVVALNSDSSVRRIKGQNRPILSFSERAKILAGLEFVDYIVEFEEDTPFEIINKIKPDLIIKGGDYKPEQVVGFGLCPVDIFEYKDVCSTSVKINKFIELKNELK